MAVSMSLPTVENRISPEVGARQTHQSDSEILVGSWFTISKLGDMSCPISPEICRGVSAVSFGLRTSTCLTVGLAKKEAAAIKTAKAMNVAMS